MAAALMAAAALGGCATTPPATCRGLAPDRGALGAPTSGQLGYQDAPAGVAHLRCLAELGIQAAELEWAQRLEAGNGVPQDLAQAAVFYQRAAMDIPSTTSVYSPPVRLGGSGSVILVRNPNAQAGSPEARFRLGLMLMEGRGISADPRRGRQLVERAAAAGHKDAQRWVAAHPDAESARR